MLKLSSVKAAVILAFPLLLGSVCAQAVQGRIATLEVVDKMSGAVLQEYPGKLNRFSPNRNQNYIACEQGQEYSVRVRNLTGERVLAIVSVDGLNVLNGKEASFKQTGYVLDPYSSADISGWRKSMSDTAAFYCTSVSDSYAGKVGKAANVGVLGVAVFKQKYVPRPYPPVVYDNRPYADSDKAERNDLAGAAPQAPQAAKSRALGSMPAPQAEMGTGHGRIEYNPVTETEFERASAPSDVLSIKYDSRANLEAKGIIPKVYSPSAFPGERSFVPDP